MNSEPELVWVEAVVACLRYHGISLRDWEKIHVPQSSCSRLEL